MQGKQKSSFIVICAANLQHNVIILNTSKWTHPSDIYIYDVPACRTIAVGVHNVQIFILCRHAGNFPCAWVLMYMYGCNTTSACMYTPMHMHLAGSFRTSLLCACVHVMHLMAHLPLPCTLQNYIEGDL